MGAAFQLQKDAHTSRLSGMPDAVVIRVPKEEWNAQCEKVANATKGEKKHVAMSRWRWVITLPWRVLKGVAASCWWRLTGTRAKE